MPAPLFANKPEQCPYGHSLAPGMPQKISWLPCICDPAREAAEHGLGMGHVTLWCGTCSAEDHRDTRFYEPPHHVGHNRPLSGWATRPDVLALRTRRPERRRWPQIDRPEPHHAQDAQNASGVTQARWGPSGPDSGSWAATEAPAGRRLATPGSLGHHRSGTLRAPGPGTSECATSGLLWDNRR